jgi:hypothetical protein
MQSSGDVTSSASQMAVFRATLESLFAGRNEGSSTNPGVDDAVVDNIIKYFEEKLRGGKDFDSTATIFLVMASVNERKSERISCFAVIYARILKDWYDKCTVSLDENSEYFQLGLISAGLLEVFRENSDVNSSGMKFSFEMPLSRELSTVMSPSIEVRVDSSDRLWNFVSFWCQAFTWLQTAGLLDSTVVHLYGSLLASISRSLLQNAVSDGALLSAWLACLNLGYVDTISYTQLVSTVFDWIDLAALQSDSVATEEAVEKYRGIVITVNRLIKKVLAEFPFLSETIESAVHQSFVGLRIIPGENQVQDFSTNSGYVEKQPLQYLLIHCLQSLLLLCSIDSPHDAIAACQCVIDNTTFHMYCTTVVNRVTQSSFYTLLGLEEPLKQFGSFAPKADAGFKGKRKRTSEQQESIASFGSAIMEDALSSWKSYFHHSLSCALECVASYADLASVSTM